MSGFGPLVSVEWLADHLEAEGVKVIDASWRMPGEPLAYRDYLARHIPGAVFFDIDAVADRRINLPHMLASVVQFENAVGAAGIRETDRVVVYDDQGLFSAARVWWNFRAMGHADIAVLDGGLPAWSAEDLPLTIGEETISAAAYHAAPNLALAASADDVRAHIASGAENGGVNIVDARPADRFSGAAPEPRPQLRRGHMPGAVNLPFSELVDNGRLRPAEELKSLFEDSGVDLNAPVITSCGSGVTAAILSLALHVLGCRDAALYDGAWAEWGDQAHDPQRFPVVADSQGRR